MSSFADRARAAVGDGVGALTRAGWDRVAAFGAIRSGSARSRRFRGFGERSVVLFPIGALHGEAWIDIGHGSIVGPECTLSVGIVPGQVDEHAPGLRIGDGVLLGRGSGIVAAESVEIGDDVFTGHHVYVTDANHGYEDPTTAIGRQFAPSRPVVVGAGSWLGHGTIVLPGACIGRHVVVGAGSVVTGELPDFSVAVGNPARVIRRYAEGDGWRPVPRDA